MANILDYFNAEFIKASDSIIGHHETQHNDIQYNDTQHNDIQRSKKKKETTISITAFKANA
jgi:hypothetical protein